MHMKLKNEKLFRQQCFIDGHWKNAISNESFEVINPSKGTVVGHVPKMGAVETRAAIDAAEKAFPAWRAKTAKERALLLRNWYNLILENIDDLAALMTTEQGKPLAEAKGELVYAANFVEWFAEEAKRTYGDVIPASVASQRIFVIKQPVGVVGAITPWNFPSSMITRKCAPALAAGCTLVLKPAEATPFSAFALAELAEKAGIPAGVLNILTGDPVAIGKEMTANPKVRIITFTGSTRVGKLLMAQSGSTVKKICLELGGSAPLIVFSDADPQMALEGLMLSKFRNSGQTCICADRIFVESSIYDEFAEQIVKRVRALKVADGFDPEAKLGPLINEAAVEKVEAHISDAVAKGARILCGGKRHPLGKTFFEPTVLTHVKPNMRIAREETFGPVVPLIAFNTEQEAITMANDTEYGLASYLFSRNIDRVIRVSEQLEFGMVSVNGGIFSSEVSPFGGIKESGLGREGSKYGIDEYLEMKTIILTIK